MKRAVSPQVFDDDEGFLYGEPVGEDASYSGPVPGPAVDADAASCHGAAAAGDPSANSSAADERRCKLRGEGGPGEKFRHRTGGAIYAFDACGYPQAPMELLGGYTVLSEMLGLCNLFIYIHHVVCDILPLLFLCRQFCFTLLLCSHLGTLLVCYEYLDYRGKGVTCEYFQHTKWYLHG
jgi:hypothetical protein